MSVTEKGLDVIAMLTKGVKTHFRYNGDLQAQQEVQRPSHYLLSVEVEMNDQTHCKYVPAKLVFVRNRNRKKDYLLLLSTDTTLPKEEIIVCKSYLKLTGECRSLSYGAMTVYVVIVFSRYTMLSVKNRAQIDDRTLGELFYAASDELPDTTWFESLRILLETLVETVVDRVFLTEKELESFIEDFMLVLPEALKCKVPKWA